MDLELKFEVKIDKSETVGGGFVASFKDLDLRGYGRSESMAVYALFFNLIYSKELLYDSIIKSMVKSLVEQIAYLKKIKE